MWEKMMSKRLTFTKSLFALSSASIALAMPSLAMAQDETAAQEGASE
jgi:hypothetical protein